MRHPSVRCFSNVAYETVPMFMWLIIALSRPFKEDRLALPLSTPLSSRQSMVLCPWLWTITGGSCHRYYFCLDKLLSRQLQYLSRQTHCGRNKHVFFATKHFSPQNISRDKTYTCGSSRQWYSTLQIFREASHLSGLPCPPVCLLGHFPSLLYAQGSIPTGVLEGGCRPLTHSSLGLIPLHFSLFVASSLIREDDAMCGPTVTS